MNKIIKKILPKGLFKRTQGTALTMADRLLSEKSNFRVQEAYRMARTNLLYSGGGEDERMVFGFTSAAPGDGKSLTCANLAISFAMSGKKVLLLDCDMHKPTQDTAFGVSTENGLSEYLAAICDAPEILPTSRKNLFLLPAGHCPPNPAELLYGARFESLIAMAQKEYDCVFIDLPPINLISDATVISKYVKGYVMVVRAGYSDSRAVQQAVEAIQTVNGKIAGFVLNGILGEDGEGGYYSRYRRYGRYGYYGKYKQYGKYGYGYYGYDKKTATDDASDTNATATSKGKTAVTAEGKSEEKAPATKAAPKTAPKKATKKAATAVTASADAEKQAAPKKKAAPKKTATPATEKKEAETK